MISISTIQEFTAQEILYKNFNFRICLGETKGYEYESVAIPWLEKKVEFCKDHLNLQKVVAPGLSEYRAYMSGIKCKIDQK